MQATASQFIALEGESRWYKFTVKPGSKINVSLTNPTDDSYEISLYEVWVTYTDTGAAYPRTWQSVGLTQDGTDKSLWTGTLSLGNMSAGNIRFVVQAA